MQIFENGYLKPEFINRNYRGLVGWPCSCMNYNYEDRNATLLSLDVEYAQEGTNEVHIKGYSDLEQLW